jgi:hypothetical protein
MTSPWAESSESSESTFETYASESTFGEGPFGEAYGRDNEWDSPFAPSEAESAFEYGQEYEALTDSESPFVTSGLASDSEIIWTPEEIPKTCKDVTFNGRDWPHGKKNINPNKPGKASPLETIPRAEVLEFQLSEFDVDRYEIKTAHRERIKELTNRILAGIREKRYTGEPIRVFTYGEASSTADHVHNLALSHHRAYNTLNAIRCAFQDAGITQPVTYGLYPTGEIHSRMRGPDRTENPNFRGVVVRAFAPLKECEGCTKPPIGTTTAICVSIPKVAPRVAGKLPPDIIPLTSVVPGLRLPIAIVTKANATVRVDDRRSRQSMQYSFQGWGLEVALPSGRTRIDLQADLRASLEILVRASASLGAQLRLGPLKLSLRVDLSVFAQLIVKLCAQLRLRLDIDLGRPNIPDLRQCRFVEARGAKGPAFPFPALTGPAFMIVPGAGYGPAILNFGGPGVASLGLTTNPMQVPADKSTIKTLLALGGSLQMLQAARREAEYEQTMENEWPEAFQELQPELAPFV